MSARRILAIGMVAALPFGCLGLPAAYGADSPAAARAGVAAKHRVVFQVSDNDPKKWNLALNNVKNLQVDLGRDSVDIEVVIYGPGLGMVRFDSEVAGRVAEALASGSRITVCENTMNALKLTKDDMLPNLSYVPAGVTEIMLKQEQGYAYIRP
jgi:intracellular sulfur oxidation DsrE/DsrF family protein